MSVPIRSRPSSGSRLRLTIILSSVVSRPVPLVGSHGWSPSAARMRHSQAIRLARSPGG